MWIQHVYNVKLIHKLWGTEVPWKPEAATWSFWSKNRELTSKHKQQRLRPQAEAHVFLWRSVHEWQTDPQGYHEVLRLPLDELDECQLLRVWLEFDDRPAVLNQHFGLLA